MLGLLLFAVVTGASAQVGAVETTVRTTGFPVEWPAGPARAAMPQWAAQGRIRFARWDGGRIETAKAMLSGWPGFNPPVPDFIESMTNWYTPPTVQLLVDAHVNTIWVTFSNGFSIETERGHMAQLKKYIEQCHRQGIRVLAYQSIANMFWEDMFERVPESKDWVRMNADGKPTPYSAGAYAKLGRVTRYMARIAHPGWQEYLSKRVDLALDAGADGIFYDNNFNEFLPETYQAIYRHAVSRKRDVVLMGNFHQASYVLNRLTNALSTEDGLEPGVYAASNLAGRLERQRSTLLPVGSGFLVNNLGLFRLLAALSDGWKPGMIEHGHREAGDRLTDPISGPRHQLALAEAAASGGSLEIFSEGKFADGLYRGRPEAMEIWRAISLYNRFLRDNEALYAGAKPVARLAIILDERSDGVPLLNGLAARNVLYEVLYEHDLTATKLRPYAAVALLTANRVRERALAALEEFAQRGGKLFVVKEAATRDENGRPRPRPALFDKATVWDQAPQIDALAAALDAATADQRVSLEAPAGVVANLTTKPSEHRLLVHLLNYTGREQSGVKVTLRGRCQGISLLSPDRGREAGFSARAEGSACLIEIPRLGIYAVLVAGGYRSP